MEKQYLIAHIEIPIEVTENQNYNILNERTSIRFDPCTAVSYTHLTLPTNREV